MRVAFLLYLPRLLAAQMHAWATAVGIENFDAYREWRETLTVFLHRALAYARIRCYIMTWQNWNRCYWNKIYAMMTCGGLTYTLSFLFLLIPMFSKGLLDAKKSSH
ncbi:MAG: hypothetical protein ACYCZH_12455 [Sulfuriferula sp.]